MHRLIVFNHVSTDESTERFAPDGATRDRVGLRATERSLLTELQTKRVGLRATERSLLMELQEIGLVCGPQRGRS